MKKKIKEEEEEVVETSGIELLTLDLHGLGNENLIPVVDKLNEVIKHINGN